MDSPQSGATTLDYNGQGRLGSSQDADGVTDLYTYAYSGLPLSVTRGGWTLGRNEYDDAGRPVVREVAGVIHETQYDNLDRVASVQHGVEIPGGPGLTHDDYAYTATDRLATHTFGPVANTDYATSYVYNDYSQLETISDPLNPHFSSLVYCVAANIRPGCVTLCRPPRRTARVRLRGALSEESRKD